MTTNNEDAASGRATVGRRRAVNLRSPGVVESDDEGARRWIRIAGLGGLRLCSALCVGACVGLLIDTV